MRAKSHPNCRVLPPCRRPLEWGHKGKMAADPATKWCPPGDCVASKTKGKLCELSSIKWCSPADHMVWETNGTKMADKKNPWGKARAYIAVLIAGEDLPRCVWHQHCQPLSPATCGMSPVLVQGHPCCRWMWGEMGFLVPIWDGPAPRPSSSCAADGIWDLQSSFWKQFLIVKCSFSEWL